MKVAICDDMDSLCVYFTALLNKVEGIEVVGAAHNGDECLQMVRKTEPDILMLDIQMRTNDEGLTIIEDLLIIEPELKIVILTAHEVEEYIFRAIALGAKDYVCKTSSDEEIVEKIRAVYEDKVMLSQENSQIIAKRAKDIFDRYMELRDTDRTAKPSDDNTDESSDAKQTAAPDEDDENAEEAPSPTAEPQTEDENEEENTNDRGAEASAEPEPTEASEQNGSGRDMII